jgi:hypothetical protein
MFLSKFTESTEHTKPKVYLPELYSGEALTPFKTGLELNSAKPTYGV